MQLLPCGMQELRRMAGSGVLEDESQQKKPSGATKESQVSNHLSRITLPQARSWIDLTLLRPVSYSRGQV